MRGRENHQVVFSIHRCWLRQVWTQYNLVSWGQVYILCLLGHTHMHVEQFSLLQLELLLIRFNILRWHRFNKASNFLSWLAVASWKLSSSPQIKMSSTIAFTPSNPPRFSSLFSEILQVLHWCQRHPSAQEIVSKGLPSSNGTGPKRQTWYQLKKIL